MLIRAYFPQILTALFGGIFVFLGIVTFGNAETFDRIYIGMLIFTGYVCRKNINVLSVVVILVLQLIWESLGWKIITNDYYFKLVLYALAFWLTYFFKYDWVVKVILPSLVLVSASEIYWYATDYPSPEIYWHIWIMISNLLVRHLIFSRLAIVEKYYPEKSLSINLDWVIYKLNAFIITIQAVMIFEYLFRHIFGFSNMLYFYYCYPYLIHGIGTISVWAIFNESYKQLIPRQLRA
jgi:hypothetical protein